MKNTQRAQNPMSEYLLKLQLIVSNTEFKNQEEANQYETLESKLNGDAYVRAIEETDFFDSYDHDQRYLYTVLLQHGYDDDRAMYLSNNPVAIPASIREEILKQDRESLIANYEEPNKYYVNLSGHPFRGSTTEDADIFVTIPDAFYQLYKDANEISEDQYIHLLPPKYIELFIASDYYTSTIQSYPDAKYLKYLGSNAIPIHIARKAHDGDILRINTSKLYTYHNIYGNVSVEPEIVHEFTNTYHDVQNYVYGTLRGDFGSIYENYNSFIRFLTIYLTIGNALNRYMKKSASMIYMNNVIANDYFMLYGLPSVIMEGKSMIDFLKQFRLLLMDKGTNVVYRVKDLIGYDYTDIYTLVMVKQQAFINGIPIYYRDENGKMQPKQEIVFRRMGTADDNTSYFKFRDNDVTYTVDEITSGDPRWWNTKEVEEMLQTMNYTLSNSKYIQLSTHMSMDDIWWECTIFLRGLLDLQHDTKYTPLNIDFNVSDLTELSVFDTVLMLVILMNWQQTDFNGHTFRGDMYLPNKRDEAGVLKCVDIFFCGGDLHDGWEYKLSSFNFRLKYEFNNMSEWETWVRSFPYLEPDTLYPMLENVMNHYNGNLGEMLMTDVKNIYKYLTNKLQQSTTIHEFRQVTEMYWRLFLVDPNREWGSSINKDGTTLLADAWGISTVELNSMINFLLTASDGQINVVYDGETIPLRAYDIMTRDVWNMDITIHEQPKKLFQEKAFVDAFESRLFEWTCGSLEVAFRNSMITKDRDYRRIIMDKVNLDVTGTSSGTRTFESLLFRTNPQAYRSLMELKGDGDSLIMFMRSIIKALETYANSPLPALEFKALGSDEYIRILKEVISYFKSYMVEFSKEEFSIIFDGLFDHGGNSNMLRLYDEAYNMTLRLIPVDSVSLYDVSHMKQTVNMKDDLHDFMYDEAIFRIRTTYEKIKNMGYEIWYDDGNRITQEPFPISNSQMVTGNLIKHRTAYKIIIPVENTVKPPNYVGNVL